MAQMGKIPPTTPRTSNNYLGTLAETQTFTKSKSASASASAVYKGGKLRKSVNLNMDVMEDGGGSDGELGPFLMLFLAIVGGRIQVGCT